MNIVSLLSGYDLSKLTVGVLGGHSALDVCHGAKKYGFKTVCIARAGREKTYAKYYKKGDRGPTFAKAMVGKQRTGGCIDEVIVKPSFQNVLDADVQKQLQEMHTIFVHNRYFWVYFDDFAKVENDFHVPIFGSRSLLKIEERDQPYTQYHLLADAGIRIPKMYKNSKFKIQNSIDRPVIVKASEASREYERGFFIVSSDEEYESVGAQLESEGKIGNNWREATVEEFVVGAPVNFNFFYSPLTDSLELMGTDTRRQTNLDGFLRMTADQQQKALKEVPLKMIETGHIAVTVKESLLEKAFEMGEKFVAQCKKLPAEIDPSGKGMIGPFALQGAVVAEDGKEDIVIFDVSFRIPGSPGTFATPYSRYLHGESMSVGERIGMELRSAVDAGELEKVVT
jgi:5-formaminoimidazole-4-carboxamide-1-(beta)-D-ribofuranosyl 5'-monophosphate synthetase